jgi:hypothetical protein
MNHYDQFIWTQLQHEVSVGLLTWSKRGQDSFCTQLLDREPEPARLERFDSVAHREPLDSRTRRDYRVDTMYSRPEKLSLIVFSVHRPPTIPVDLP